VMPHVVPPEDPHRSRAAPRTYPAPGDTRSAATRTSGSTRPRSRRTAAPTFGVATNQSAAPTGSANSPKKNTIKTGGNSTILKSRAPS
jgi:hypothetical protein